MSHLLFTCHMCDMDGPSNELRQQDDGCCSAALSMGNDRHVFGPVLQVLQRDRSCWRNSRIHGNIFAFSIIEIVRVIEILPGERQKTHLSCIINTKLADSTRASAPMYWSSYTRKLLGFSTRRVKKIQKLSNDKLIPARFIGYMQHI